jgi:hypothetical protein
MTLAYPRGIDNGTRRYTPSQSFGAAAAITSSAPARVRQRSRERPNLAGHIGHRRVGAVSPR